MYNIIFTHVDGEVRKLSYKDDSFIACRHDRKDKEFQVHWNDVFRTIYGEIKAEPKIDRFPTAGIENIKVFFNKTLIQEYGA